MTLSRRRLARQLRLEERIHACLCGSMDVRQARGLRRLLVSDKKARDLMAEMKRFQRDARQALRFDSTAEVMRRSLIELLARVPGKEPGRDGWGAGRPARRQDP